MNLKNVRTFRSLHRLCDFSPLLVKSQETRDKHFCTTSNNHVHHILLRLFFNASTAVRVLPSVPCILSHAETHSWGYEASVCVKSRSCLYSIPVCQRLSRALFGHHSSQVCSVVMLCYVMWCGVVSCGVAVLLYCVIVCIDVNNSFYIHNENNQLIPPFSYFNHMTSFLHIHLTSPFSHPFASLLTQIWWYYRHCASHGSSAIQWQLLYRPQLHPDHSHVQRRLRQNRRFSAG